MAFSPEPFPLTALLEGVDSFDIDMPALAAGDLFALPAWDDAALPVVPSTPGDAQPAPLPAAAALDHAAAAGEAFSKTLPRLDDLGDEDCDGPAAAAQPLALENNKTALDARWPRELIEMDLPEYRRYMKTAGYSREDRAALGAARRRFRNRQYAKTSRAKRMTREKGTKAEHSKLRDAVDEFARENDALRRKNEQLLRREQQYLSLIVEYTQLTRADVERLLAPQA